MKKKPKGELPKELVVRIEEPPNGERFFVTELTAEACMENVERGIIGRYRLVEEHAAEKVLHTQKL